MLRPNCLDYVCSGFALSKLGAIEVAISDAYKGPFLAHPFGLSRGRVLIVVADLIARVAEIEADLPDLQQIFLGGDDAAVAEAASCFDRVKVARYGALLSDKETNPGIAVGPGDPAAVLMTSGTTGPSKGVVMLHSQFYFFAEEDVQLTRLTADDVYMTGFPLLDRKSTRLNSSH